MAKKQDKITPTRVVSSREAFERKRRGVLATGPSGEVYRLRRLNLERHAFAGGLPKGFAKIATEGEDAVAQLFADMGDPELSEEERKRYAAVGQ